MFQRMRRIVQSACLALYLYALQMGVEVAK